MSRLKFWTILLGTEPTAFRASDPAELQPTLRQLQRHRPEATIKWFEHGRLWASPEEAEAAREAAARVRRARDKSWRPGGAHRDPRERFKKPRDERRPDILRRLRAKTGRQGGSTTGDSPLPGPAGEGRFLKRTRAGRSPQGRPAGHRPERPRSAGRPGGSRSDRRGRKD
jgi:hypothetical protein